MTENKNLTELINSHQFQCRGTTDVAGIPALSREEAVPVIVKIYRDGKSEAECTCLAEDSCEASSDSTNCGTCPYVTKTRGNQK